MNIRAATKLDSAAIRALVFEVLKEYGLKPDPASTDNDLEDVEVAYARAGGAFDVMVDDAGVIVGTVGLYKLSDNCCELRKMYLSRQCRGKGMGRKLLEHALQRARELGFRRVELETAGVLKEAVALYARYGFKPFARRHLAARCDQAYFLGL